MGCGGIGGVIATRLAAAGIDVTAVSRNESVRRAVDESGFRAFGVDGEHRGTGRIVAEAPEGPFDFVFLTTQPTDVEDAAAQSLRALGENGSFVCFQNGLCEIRVADLCGDSDRVVGAIVSWGASMHQPGLFERTSLGRFVIGGYGDVSGPVIEDLEALLQHIAPVGRTDNLYGARWSKLALNCVVSALGTLNGSTLGGVMKSRRARSMALGIVSEAVAVAGAAEIQLEKISGTLNLEWLALDARERKSIGSVSLLAKHSMLLAVGMKYRRLYSSMLRAIEAGKPPSVDFLNGEVVHHGQVQGVSTPINAAICRAIHALARGEVEAGPALIRAVDVEARSESPGGCT
jgi:2-dehydropantoate 2-reductase